MKASDILGFNDLTTKVVKVKQWNCKLTIRELSLNDGIRWFQMAQELGDKIILDAEDIAQVVVMGVIDSETGEYLFSDDDIPALKSKNRDALMFLYQEITKLSGAVAEKN